MPVREIKELPLIFGAEDRSIDRTTSPFYSGKDSFLENCDVYKNERGLPYIMNREGLEVNDVTKKSADINGVGSFIKYVEINDASFPARDIYLAVASNNLYVFDNVLPTAWSSADELTTYTILHSSLDAIAWDAEKIVLKDVFDLYNIDLTGASPTITKLTPGSNYPNASAQGMVYLNGHIFVLDRDTKRIYNSTAGDPTASWPSGNFITPDTIVDKACAIALHNDHIVYFGSKSIEFFYYANNPTGSPLSRRTDLTYNIGTSRGYIVGDDGTDNKMPIVQIGNIIYFWGTTDAEYTYQLMKLENFQITPYENIIIDKYTNPSGYTSAPAPSMCHIRFNNEDYLFVQPAVQVTDWHNFMINVKTGNVVYLSTNITNLDLRSLSYTANSYFLTGTGVLGEVKKNVFKDRDDSNTTDYDIDMIIQTPNFTGGALFNKFGHSFELNGDYLSGETVDVQYSKDDYANFSTARSLDISKRKKLTRFGKFNRIAFKLTYSGQNRYRVNNAQFEFTRGEV